MNTPPIALSVAFLFCFVFNVEIAGITVSLGMLTIALGLVYVLLTGSIRIRAESRSLLSNLMLVPAIAWSWLSSIVHQSDADLLALLFLKTYLFCVIAANVYSAAFFSRIPTPSKRMEFLLQSIVLAFVIQAICVVVSFLSPDFRDFVDRVLEVKGNLTGLEGFRVKGFANSGGANLSMAMCFASAVAFHMGFQRDRAIYMAYAAVILCASALVGRSGMAGFVLLVLGFTFLLLLKGKLRVRHAKMLAFLLAFLGAIGVVAAMQAGADELDLWQRWFLGEAQDSVTELTELFEHKYTVYDILGGKGFYEDELIGSSRTDSGYLKTMFSVGAPLAVLFYAALLIKYVRGARVFVRLAEDRHAARAFILLFVALIFFYEGKEAMAYQNFTGRLLLFMFIVSSTFLPRRPRFPKLDVSPQA